MESPRLSSPHGRPDHARQALLWILTISLACSSPSPTPAPAPPAPTAPAPAPPAPAAPAAAAAATPWPSAPADLAGAAEGQEDATTPSGTVRLLYGIAETPIGGVLCTAYLHVATDSWGCQLAQPYPVPDLAVTVPIGADLSFHYGAARPTFVELSALTPPQPTLVVDTVTCGGVVRLDRDGHLISCTLAAPHEWMGWTVPAGDEVTLQRGRLLRVWGPAPVTRGETSVPADPAARFDPATGEPSGAEAASDSSAGPESELDLAAKVPEDAVGALVPLYGEMEGLYGHRWKLTRTVDLAGVRCSGDLDESYSEWSCTLAQPYAVATPPVVVRAGTRLRFHLGPPRPTALDLASLDPAPATLDLDGVSCRGTLSLDPAGRLTGCTLAAPHTFGPWTLPEGAGVRLDGGQLTDGQLAAPYRFGELPCRDVVSVDPSGQVTGCRLAEAHTLGPWTLPEGTLLTLAGGKLQSAEIETDTTLGDRPIAAGHTVTFQSDPDVIGAVYETSYGD